MWADLPPSPSATSMPIQVPAYREYVTNGANPEESATWLQTANALGTSPASSPAAKGMLLIVDGVPFLVVPQSLRREHSTDAAVAEWSVPEQLDRIKSRLDISVTQLAELFSVTRKTVYDWYEGQSPRYAKSDQIKAIIEILAQRDDIDLKRLKSFWNIDLPGGSFRASLQSDTLKGQELRTALTEKLDELSAEMSATTRVFRRGAASYTSESTLADIERRNDAY